MVHTKDNRQKKRERGNYFSFFSEDNKIIYLNQYIEYLIESEDIKNKTAFRIAIKKKFNKKDKDQLEDFERWYLQSACKQLRVTYRSSQVIQILPYFEVTNTPYDTKILIETSNDGMKVFKTGAEAEEYLKELLSINA